MRKNRKKKLRFAESSDSNHIHNIEGLVCSDKTNKKVSEDSYEQLELDLVGW